MIKVFSLPFHWNLYHFVFCLEKVNEFHFFFDLFPLWDTNCERTRTGAFSLYCGCLFSSVITLMFIYKCSPSFLKIQECDCFMFISFSKFLQLWLEALEPCRFSAWILISFASFSPSHFEHVLLFSFPGSASLLIDSLYEDRGTESAFWIQCQLTLLGGLTKKLSEYSVHHVSVAKVSGRHLHWLHHTEFKSLAVKLNPRKSLRKSDLCLLYLSLFYIIAASACVCDNEYIWPQLTREISCHSSHTSQVLQFQLRQSIFFSFTVLLRKKMFVCLLFFTQGTITICV